MTRFLQIELIWSNDWTLKGSRKILRYDKYSFDKSNSLTYLSSWPKLNQDIGL